MTDGNDCVMAWLADQGINWLPMLISVETKADGTKKKIYHTDETMRIQGIPKKCYGYDAFTGDGYNVNAIMKRFTEKKAFFIEQARMHLPNAYWVLCVDTNSAYILDVDDEEIMEDVKPLLENHAYYLSTTKKLPKIIFFDSKMSCAEVMKIGKQDIHLKVPNVKFFDGRIEVQKGQWSIMNLDTEIYNNDEIKILDVERFVKSIPFDKYPSKTINTPSTPIKTTPLIYNKENDLFKFVSCLKDSRADDVNEWLRVGYALKSTNDENAFHAWRFFSQKSRKYNDANFEVDGDDYNIWEKLDPNRISIRSLRWMAQNDNPSLYAELFGRSYDDIKKWFECRCSFVNNPPSYLVEEIDGSVQTLDEKKFISRWRHLKYENTITEVRNKTTITKTVSIPFVKEWMNDENKRFVEKIAFEVKPTNDNIYNTYKGLRVEGLLNKTYNEEKLNKVLEFVKYRLSGNDDKFFKWFIDWLSLIVQKPYKITRVAVVLKSVEGIGKGIFSDFYGNKIIGYSYEGGTSNNGVLGQFNTKVENVIFLNIDEVKKKDITDNHSQFYRYVGSDILAIEGKGVNTKDVTNYLNIWLTTNKDIPVPISKTDRRFCCVESKAPRLTDDEIHFYLDLFNDEETQYTFYTYLKNNIVDYDITVHRPITDFYKECKRQTSSYDLNFLGFFVRGLSQEEKESTRYFRTYLDLYSEFEFWVQRFNKMQSVPSYREFTSKMCKLPGVEVKRYTKIENEKRKDLLGILMDVPVLIQYLKDNVIIDEEEETYGTVDDIGIQK